MHTGSEIESVSSVISEILSDKHCERCTLNKSKNHIFVRNETISLNQDYHREEIDLLFVAESPPMAYLKDHSKYFYASGQVKRSGLFYHMMSVLFKNEMKKHSKHNKEHFLKKFRNESRFYLVDMVKCPINKLFKKEKRKPIKSCSRYLNKELHTLDFQRAVFIGKSSFKEARKHLDLDFNYAVISLPFGSNKNVQDFREELTALCELRSHVIPDRKGNYAHVQRKLTEYGR